VCWIVRRRWNASIEVTPAAASATGMIGASSSLRTGANPERRDVASSPASGSVLLGGTMTRLGKTTLAIACSMFVALTACGSADIGSDFGRPGSGGSGEGDGLLGGENGLGDADPGEAEVEACATHTAAAEPSPVFLVVMYDRSGSMDGTRWNSCKAAMKAFFESNDSKGIHASLTFFPQGTTCNANTFAQPAVAITPLPDATFGQRLDQTNANGGTPTRPALEGAVRYADQIADAEARDGKVAIVLVTDGAPNGCSSSVSNVSQVAQNASTKYPTYVVGVGNVSNMDTIAQAGGTNKAFVVSTSDPAQTQQDLLKAMNEIRQSALSCEYTIPPPPEGEELDKEKVNVVYTPETGAAEKLTYDEGCAGGKGWRYDDPSAPTRIVICESTCDTVKSQAGKIDVEFGCARRGGVN
jgi:uncharacterized protein YegL